MDLLQELLDNHAPILACAFALLVGVGLVLIRALIGPTVYDRILAVNMMGTKTVVLLALIGTLAGRHGYLDIALLYALMNYIATIAILKIVEHRRLG